MKTYLHRPIKILQFLTFARIKKCLKQYRNILALSPMRHLQAEPRILFLICYSNFLTCYSCSTYSSIRNLTLFRQDGELVTYSMFFVDKIFTISSLRWWRHHKCQVWRLQQLQSQLFSGKSTHHTNPKMIAMILYWEAIMTLMTFQF